MWIGFIVCLLKIENYKLKIENYKMLNLTKMTQDAMTFTEEVTTRWASRITGSEACLACGDYLKEQMATFCDGVKTQEFKVRPGAFLGYIRINIGLYFLSLGALFVEQLWIATTLGSLALLISVLQFFVYWEFVDFLFPLKKGKNIIGHIEPIAEVKQQIIISAHHDSAHIFNFLANEPENYNQKVMGGMTAMFALPIFTWILLGVQLLGWEWMPLYWGLTGILALMSFRVYQLWFFYDAKNGTPGAGDNMVCTALAMEIGKYFAAQKADGNGLKHTRVVVASWDAEEAGLRGARAYTKAHKAALLATKTYNFNLECMYDHQELGFLTSDLNSFVKLSTPMAEECVQVAKSLGYKMPTTVFPFLAGGTDSAEFAKIGVESTCLAAMSWTTRGEMPAYHTLRDTIDAVDTEAVRRSIEVGIQYILNKDKSIL